MRHAPGEAAAPPRPAFRPPQLTASVLLALPAAIVLFALYAIPLVRLMASSFVGPSGLSFQAYSRVLGDAYGRSHVWNSVRLGALTTVIALAVGYLAAFGLAFARGALRSVFRASLFLPLAASVIVKSFAWSTLMRSHGVVNEALMELHLTSTPIRLLFTQVSLISGSVNIFLLFMILPIYSVVAQIDPRLTEAAATLGASPLRAFLRVVLPLSLPGIVAGVSLVFSLSVSAYVVPTAHGGELSDIVDDLSARLPAPARPSFGFGGGRNPDGDRTCSRRCEPLLRREKRRPMTGALARWLAVAVMALASVFLLAPPVIIALSSLSPTPVFAGLSRFDFTLIDAARMLGCGFGSSIWRVMVAALAPAY
jgi:putative spermidine/putrescine transport system permease protein